jgi:hypothetical protein
MNDHRYLSMLTVCPWLSSPLAIPVHFVGHEMVYTNPDRPVHMSFNNARWKMHCSTGVGMEDSILIEAYVNGFNKIFTVPIRPQSRLGFVQQVFDTMPPDLGDDASQFYKDDARAVDLMSEHSMLHSQTPFSDVSFAHMNDSVDIVAQMTNNFPEERNGILFVSRTEEGRMLRRIPSKIICTPPVLFRPAELWILDEKSASIMYYGPRHSKSITTTPAVWPAYIMAQRGLANEALAYLEQKNLSANTVLFDKRKTLLMSCINANICERDIQPVIDASKLSINAKDKYDKTALTYAIEKADSKLVKQLLEQGAEITVNTFHVAVYDISRTSRFAPDGIKDERMQILNRIMDGWDNIDAPSGLNRCTTALMIAARASNNEMVKILLDRGAAANPMIKDYFGETALDIFNQVHIYRGEYTIARENKAMRQMLGNAMRKRAVKR